MQILRKFMLFFKSISIRLWITALLVYSLLMFIYFVRGVPSFSVILIFPLYIFVPGYAFTIVVFAHLDEFEKVAASIGMSLALFTGVRGLLRISGLTGFMLEHTIVVLFSIIFLIGKLFFRRQSS